MALLSSHIAEARYAQVARHIIGDVLDLGCQNAQILERYAGQTTSYTGVERSSRTVAQLQQRHRGASFHCRDLDHDPLELERGFDCVLMIALIEQLFNQEFVMNQVARGLKPGGIVVLTTPTPFGNDVVHRLGAAFGLFSRAAVDDHVVLYNRHRFRLLAKEVGLQMKSHRYFQLHCNQLSILARD